MLRKPTDRPPTKAECIAIAREVYAGRPEEEIVGEAIDDFCWSYARWVNLYGWRKPADWDGERRVALHELRKTPSPIFGDLVRAWATTLRKGASERREAAAQH